MRKINLLSIVVPCYNEVEVLPASHQRLSAILENLRSDGTISRYELVYIDNGSTDGTLAVLKKFFLECPAVRILELRKNFGYQGSISAGLSYAAGDAVITIDADLQDPPEKISEMIQEFQQGYDLVLGVRIDRLSDSFLKRHFSQAYYRLLKMLGVEIVYNHGDFRLMSRSLVKEFNLLPERSRLIRAMILQLESRYAVVTYKREPRSAGASKFNFSALMALSIDGVISFSYVPLRFAAFLGTTLCFVSFLGAAWVLYIKTTTDVLPGWASTLLPLFFFNGVQLFVLGMMGEYMGKLFIEVKQRPIFLVREEHSHT